MGSVLCSALAAARRLRDVPRFPSGRWIFPVPRLGVCPPLCSAPGSPAVPAVPRALPCSTRSIWQFPQWQAAQEPELEWMSFPIEELIDTERGQSGINQAQ